MPFPITCAACQKTFSIADDVYERKVKGRVVTIKCKQCQAGIRVDGTKDTPVFSMAGDSVRPPPVAPAPVAAAPAPEAALKEQPKTAPAAATSTPKSAPNAAAPKAEPAAAPKAAPTVAAAAQKAPQAAAAPAAKAPPAATAKAATPAVRAQPATVAAKAPNVATGPKAQPGVTPRAPAVAAAPKAPAATPAAKAAPPATTADAPRPVAAPPAASESLWAVDYPDGEDRELTMLEIEKELARGVINPATLVWREGMAEWLELEQVAELRSLATPPKPPPPAPLLAQRPKAASAPALPELSATLPRPPAARPPAPSSPAIDFALRDALNPAPPAPPAPAPKSPPAFGASANVRAPTPPPAFAQPIAALTPPAFPAASQPLTAASFQQAPAAALPFGRPNATPFGAVAPIADVPEWPKKSRLPLIVGGIAVVAVGALIFVLTRSSGDALPPPTPISALPEAAPTTPSTPRAAEPAPTDTGAPPAQRTGSGDPMEPPGSGPVATPNAGFAELFASGARTADEKHGVTGPTQRFDAKAAKAALATAAAQTPQCREKGGPAGKATVVVTFEASGKVSSATVSDPPFAGTSSGACIAAALKRATVPAFSGLPGTVTKIISIQ